MPTPPFIHPTADVQSSHIGDGTRIWQFCVVLPEARIGASGNICSHCFIENDVVIGDRVTIKCGVQIWDGLRIEDDVFIGPNATFTNDKFPRSRQHLPNYPETRLRSDCSIGAGAVILPGVEIGSGAMIGAGTVVTDHIPAHAIVVGNPGRIVGYTDKEGETLSANRSKESLLQSTIDLIGGAKLFSLKSISDLRGNLLAIDTNQGLPFTPKRVFFVHRVPSTKVRGEHAHKECGQFLVAVNGSVHVLLDDGTNRQEVRLENGEQGLYIPPMLWAAQYKYSSDAVLAVLASHEYDADDYIRDYQTYLAAAGKR